MMGHLKFNGYMDHFFPVIILITASYKLSFYPWKEAYHCSVLFC